MIAFFFTIFPSALAYGSLKAAVALGAVLFALECFALVDLARRREAAPRLEVFAVCVMLFATASAAMATPARAQFGAIQAAQSRYASYAMACNAGLLLWSLSRVCSSLVEPVARWPRWSHCCRHRCNSAPLHRSGLDRQGGQHRLVEYAPLAQWMTMHDCDAAS